MARKLEYPPGTLAPSAGEYAQIGPLGSRTGLRVGRVAGQALPAAPIGFAWVLAEPSRAAAAGADPRDDARAAAGRLRLEAAAYERMAAGAQTPAARNELLALARRFAAAAAELEAGELGATEE